MRSEAADPFGEDDPFVWREEITGHEAAEELNAASGSSSCPPAVASRTFAQAEQADIIRNGLRRLDGLDAVQWPLSNPVFVPLEASGLAPANSAGKGKPGPVVG